LLISFIGISQIGGIEAEVCRSRSSKWLCESKQICSNHNRELSPFASRILTSRHIPNKKFEIMLTRCTKAYSSSCSQIGLVYLQPFRHNSQVHDAAENCKKKQQ